MKQSTNQPQWEQEFDKLFPLDSFDFSENSGQIKKFFKKIIKQESDVMYELGYKIGANTFYSKCFDMTKNNDTERQIIQNVYDQILNS